jgi:glycosyltransferase involved in cell wall biosynthesis
LMLSVLILTFNEEHDLPGCLASLSWCDDIVVYDSYSTDLTQHIAEASGARFIQRPDQDPSISFGGNEALHRTWGIRNIPFNHPWLLVLDADERLSPNALHEIDSVFNNLQSQRGDLTSPGPVAFQLRRRDFFQGRHLKHVQSTPWYIRLFRPAFVHYERLVNPVTVVDGSVASLQCYIDHYPFSKGLSHWIARHNTYSTLEAIQLCSDGSYSQQASLVGALFSPYFHQRRAQQKQLFMRLRARPLLKFLWLYLLKRGFLDGAQGFTYALLQCIYEYFIVLKVRELKQTPYPPS